MNRRWLKIKHTSALSVFFICVIVIFPTYIGIEASYADKYSSDTKIDPMRSVVDLAVIEPSRVPIFSPKVSSSIFTTLSSRSNTERVVLDLRLSPQDILPNLREMGVNIEMFHDNLVQVVIDRNHLTLLAEQPWVRYIREPSYAVPLQLTTEGLEVLRGEVAHRFRVNGSGVRVAVVDLGFDVTNREIASRIVEARSFRADGDIRTDDPSHGTAVAEIIVDMAPQVQLYLYNVDTSVSFLRAIDYVISRQVQLISISLGFFNNGWYDGTSTVSRKLDEARARGILPIVAAGNAAQDHWEGGFSDTDGDRWQNFAGADETNAVYLKAGQSVSVFLSWNDWPLSSQDYDLYLFDSSLTFIVARSGNPQTGSFPPIEELAYTAPAEGWYHIAVRRISATRDVYLELFTGAGPPLEHTVVASSIPNLGDARGALTVAAAYWRTEVLETFSSRGPTNDGRIKPDITGPDGVRTTALVTFFGTSAATPHITGVAALLLSANPTLNADQIQALLESGAIDAGAVGRDAEYGAGNARVRLSVFDSSPAKVALTIDGISYPATSLPRAFVWPVGSQHQVEAIDMYQPANLPGTRYRFSIWSDGSVSRTRTFTYDPLFQGWNATNITQYLLIVSSPHGNPQGSGWYDEGKAALISASHVSDVVLGQNRKNLFSWNLDGGANQIVPRSGSGNFTTSPITMNGPRTVSLNYVTQYYLTVRGGQSAAYINSQTGDGWYDAGTNNAKARTNYSWNVTAGRSRTSMISWQLDGKSPISVTRTGSGTFTTPEIVMSTYHMVQFNGVTQYDLAVKGVDRALYVNSQTNDGWYDGRTLAQVQINHVENVTTGKSRANLVRWSLDGGANQTVTRKGSGNFTSPTIAMNTYHVLTFSFVTQYYLGVVGGIDASYIGSQISDGWYDAGRSAKVQTVYISDVVANQSRKNLIAWQVGSGANQIVPRSGSGNFTTAPITMNGPRTVSLNYVTQYYLTISGGSGITYSVLSQTGDGWFDLGTTTQIKSVHVWNEAPGRSRENLVSYTLDGITTNLTRANEGSGGPTVSSNTYHSLSFNSAVQYLLTISGGNNTRHIGSQTEDGWFDLGTTARAQTDYTWSVVKEKERKNLVSWAVDQGPSSQVPRSSAGVFVTPSMAVDKPMSVKFEAVTQYFLSVRGGANIRIETVSLTRDRWFDEGSKLLVATDYVWDTVPDKSRSTLVAWVLDGNQSFPVPRSNSGTFSTPILVVNKAHSLTFEKVTQYYLKVTGGWMIQIVGSQISDQWFDQGSLASVSSDYTWDVVPGKSRQNLISYTSDGDTANITRSTEGRLTTSITLNTYHTLNLNTITQYFLLVNGGSNIRYGTPSPTNDNWYDVGQATTVSSDYTWGVVHEREGRKNLVSWKIDEGEPSLVPRSSKGIFVTTPITMNQARTVTFHGVTQYFLTIVGGGSVKLSHVSPTGDPWFDEATSLTISSNYVWDVIPERSRRNLISYTSSKADEVSLPRKGSGAFTMSVLVDNPLHVKFNEATQYLLRVVGGNNIRYSTPSPTNDNWYDAGQTTEVLSEYVWDVLGGTPRNQLASWQLDEGQKASVARSEAASFTTPRIRMDTYHTITFYHAVQFFLTLDPGGGSLDKASQWLDQDSRIAITAISPANVVANRSRLIFLDWSGSIASSEGTITLTMDTFKSLKANWKTEYYVRAISQLGVVTGGGWYDAGSTAPIKVAPSVSGLLVQQVFEGWTGDIVSMSPEVQITIDGPKVVTAKWRTEYVQLIILAVALAGTICGLLLLRKVMPKLRSPKNPGS